MKTASTLFIVVALGLATGCTPGGRRAAQPGTAAFSWAEAQDGYRTGDLLKTDHALLKLAGTESAFTAQARVWQLVVSAGLTDGFSGLADAYEAGSLRAGAGSMRFRTEASKLRSAAATTALEFAQAIHNTAETAVSPDQNVTFAFGFPPGSAVPPEGLLKISSGVWLGDSARQLVERSMLQRGVLRAVSAAVGFPEDAAKARVFFETSPLTMPHEAFVTSMAGLLYEQSELFGPRRMDRPERLKLMCHEALTALQSLPLTEDRKELITKIQGSLKKSGGA